MVAFNSTQFRMYETHNESLKADDSTFMEKSMSLEYRGVQEHFITTLLGGARFAGALEQGAKRSEEIARVAVV